MTRRRVVIACLALVAGFSGLAWFWRPLRLARWLARILGPRLDPRAPTGALTDAEAETLVAFAEVLVEGRTLASSDRRLLAGHIAERAGGTAGYLSLYRAMARRLDEWARRPFGSLDLRERVELMIANRMIQAPGPLEYLLPFRRDELALRTIAIPDLIEAYYRSAAGWAVVGYTTFPGRCGDLARYTRPED